MRILRPFSVVFALWLFLSLQGAAFAASSFSDVPESDPLSPAVEFLKAGGVLSGYPDGTFRAKQLVTRGEAVKLIVSTKMTAEQVSALTIDGYNDMPADAWYRPYVAAAANTLRMIDAPPKAAMFRGAAPVTKIEFLKMLLIGQGIDPASYGEIALPVANDAEQVSEWHYPYTRYGITASLISVDENGELGLSRQMTRGDVATMLYYLSMYQSGRRTQALLSEEESELVNVLQMMEQKNLEQAEYASARALLAARGAHAVKPDLPIVKAALKTAEAFRALVRAYRAGSEGQLEQAIALSKEAWSLAEAAKQMSPGLAELAVNVQTISRGMADQARSMQQQ